MTLGQYDSSKDPISVMSPIIKVSVTSTREETERKPAAAMLPCSTWLVTVSLGLGTAWGQVESSADVEVVSTIAQDGRQPTQPLQGQALC